MTVAQAPLRITGTGLITGQSVSVDIVQGEPGKGMRFILDGVTLPAQPEFVISTDRGVTLGAEGKTLSIVEHFLSACAMLGLNDLEVTVMGAPELPLLDGSAQSWTKALSSQFESTPALPLQLAHVVEYSPRPDIRLIALPSDTLEISYLVDFPHPDLKNRWITWREDMGPLTEMIAPARTFGMAAELPLLQSRGLAMGVTTENTLGLTDEGGYTSALRFDDEPLRHKILDLIGDLMLCDVPILQLKARMIIFWGGHTAHIAFGQQLAKALKSA